MNPQLVAEARQLETQWLRKFEVYRKVPAEEAVQAGIRPITVRWVDANKGTSNHSTDRGWWHARFGARVPTESWETHSCLRPCRLWKP